jgi:hypothetical protein
MMEDLKMIDPITGAILIITGASLDASAHIVHFKKTIKLAKVVKQQRIELALLEGGLVVAAGASFIDTILTKKKMRALETMTEQRLNLIADKVNELEMRVNSINLSALDAKLDMVVAATATPKIVPKKDDTEEEMGD